MQPTTAGIMQELRAQDEGDDIPVTLSRQTLLSKLQSMHPSASSALIEKDPRNASQSDDALHY